MKAWREAAGAASIRRLSAGAIRWQVRRAAKNCGGRDRMEKELGILSEGLRNIEAQLQEARESRKQVYTKLESTDRKVDHLVWRVEALEKNLGTISPTVQEFAAYKMQAQGAGKLGVALWRIGGWVLAAAAGAVSAWAWVSTHLK